MCVFLRPYLLPDSLEVTSSYHPHRTPFLGLLLAMLTSNAIIRNNTTNTTLALLICLWSSGSGTYQPAVFTINTGSYWREKNPALLQPFALFVVRNKF
jgi:hypothetical protein